MLRGPWAKLAVPAILLVFVLAAGRMISDATGPPEELPPRDALHIDRPRIGDELTDADRRLRAEITLGGRTAEAGARAAVRSGFRHFFNEDYASAMQRFNEAWVLDPENGDLYHGFALVLFARDDDRAGAERMFKEAVARARTGAGAWANYGRFLIAEARYGEAVDVLEEARARAPDLADATARLAIARYAMGDYMAACRLAAAVVGDAPDAERPVLERMLDSAACR